MSLNFKFSLPQEEEELPHHQTSTLNLRSAASQSLSINAHGLRPWKLHTWNTLPSTWASVHHIAIPYICSITSLFGKMSTSFHSFSSHSSQNESGMRKWPKNDVLWPEWDWPHPNHLLSFISFRGHPTPRTTLEWEKTSFSGHFRGITKPNFPSSEKCFNFRTVGIEGQTNDTEWLGNDKNGCGMIGMSPKWDEWRKNDVDDCHIIWIDQNWDERQSNDMNESRMRWMTVEWCEWV